MSVKDIITRMRGDASYVGSKLSMSKFNDAMARALYGRPYSSCIAAENAGRPPTASFDMDRIKEVAAAYGLGASILALFVKTYINMFNLDGRKLFRIHPDLLVEGRPFFEYQRQVNEGRPLENEWDEMVEEVRRPGRTTKAPSLVSGSDRPVQLLPSPVGGQLLRPGEITLTHARKGVGTPSAAIINALVDEANRQGLILDPMGDAEMLAEMGEKVSAAVREALAPTPRVEFEEINKGEPALKPGEHSLIWARPGTKKHVFTQHLEDFKITLVDVDMMKSASVLKDPLPVVDECVATLDEATERLILQGMGIGNRLEQDSGAAPALPQPEFWDALRKFAKARSAINEVPRSMASIEGAPEGRQQSSIEENAQDGRMFVDIRSALAMIVRLDADPQPGLMVWREMRQQAHQEAVEVLAATQELSDYEPRRALARIVYLYTHPFPASPDWNDLVGAAHREAAAIVMRNG